MHEIAHGWHKHPGKDDHCTICGCPRHGTAQNGTWHRAIAESEDIPALYVKRNASKTGWKQTLIGTRSPIDYSALPLPVCSDTDDPNRFVWHRRQWRQSDGPCFICGCPKAGTTNSTSVHRAIADSEGFAFDFLIRTKNVHGHSYNPVERIASASAPAPIPVIDYDNPGSDTLSLMSRAALLQIIGKHHTEVESAMQLKPRTIAMWQQTWAEHWDTALHSAKEQLLNTIRAQVGTEGMLSNAREYIERARIADQLASRNGERLFPAHAKPTVCTFFESYVLPVCLHGVKPQTIGYYRAGLNLWRLITGDPPIDEVTTELLVLFRDTLTMRPGIKNTRRASLESVKSRMRAIQTILDKAGPPARRNRDAKGIVPVVPWIRPVRTEEKLPRIIAADVLKLAYDATAGMDMPCIPGIKPPAWWKALIVVCYNTQLRRRTLFEMRMDEIDWPNHRLLLPAGRMKAGRPMIVHLNAAAMEHLQAIRTKRELVFETGHQVPWFHKYFHRLQDSAGIPRKDHFGLHAIRKTAATVLAESSPKAAQLALGHTSLSTTMRHYINSTSIVGGALDAMPQPFGPSLSK